MDNEQKRQKMTQEECRGREYAHNQRTRYTTGYQCNECGMWVAKDSDEYQITERVSDCQIALHNIQAWCRRNDKEVPDVVKKLDSRVEVIRKSGTYTRNPQEVRDIVDQIKPLQDIYRDPPPVEKPQRYQRGNRIRIVTVGHPLWKADGKGGTTVVDMAPEKVGKEAIVEYSYRERYGGSIENQPSYSIVWVDTGYSESWKYEYQMELIDEGSEQLLVDTLAKAGKVPEQYTPYPKSTLVISDRL